MAVKKVVLLGAMAPCWFFLSGCLIPYGYPSISWTPVVNVGPEQADVRAFRVDVTADIADLNESDHHLLAEVAPWPTGHVPPQARASLDYGVYVFGIALNYPVHRGHTTRLRLYRPGHQLVEVKSWDLPGSVSWTEAPDLASQEKAVDDLLRAPRIDRFRGQLRDRVNEPGKLESEPWRLGELPPGSTSAGHRKALLFAAGEYDRIAALSTPADEESRRVLERATAKARWLRDLAVK